MSIKHLSILAYSDIHYHHYTNGLTLSDVESVESDMLERAIEHKVDFILFCGDRFMSRNPMYEAALASDRMLRKISESGIPLYMLVGNHDRLTKNDFKTHTLSHVRNFPKDLPNITVMDTVGTHTFNTKRGASVTIHSVPAGHSPSKLAGATLSDFNIVAFHGMILGSLYQNGTKAEDGLSVSSFDIPGMDLVLGGDNHCRQELKGLKYCRGFYAGAPMQHNWGDEGAERGFLQIDMKTVDGHMYRSCPAIGFTWMNYKGPRFMRVSWVTDSLDKLAFAATHGTSSWNNNIIRLNISGPSAVLNDLDVELWKTKLLAASGARSIDIKLKYTINEDKAPIIAVVSDIDEWKAYLNTKMNTLDQIDTDHLEKLGVKYINNT